MGTRPVIALTFADVAWGYGESEARYVAAVEAAGGEPLVVRAADGADVPSLLRRAAGFLLPGGDDLAPEYYGEEPHANLGRVNGPRDRMEFLLARALLAEDRPVLGICNGLQVLNVAAGGDLHQDVPSQVPGAVEHRRGATHAVTPEPGTRFAALAGTAPIEVNSFHHQSVRRVGRGLRVAARSADGLVEALERPGARFLLAVQWHPERPRCGPGAGAELVAALVEAAAVSIPFRASDAP